ncbi:unnamed protein product, partial [Ilex paraguariensis]
EGNIALKFGGGSAIDGHSVAPRLWWRGRACCCYFNCGARAMSLSLISFSIIRVEDNWCYEILYGRVVDGG